MPILPHQYLQACSRPASSCSRINIELVLWCQASLNTGTPESRSSQESPPLSKREGDKSLVVNVLVLSMSVLKVNYRTWILLHPAHWCDDVNMPSPGQAQAAWELITRIWHCYESQLTKCKVCEVLGLPGWGSSPDWDTSVIIFQGEGGKRNCVSWQTLGCRRRSSQKQRGNSRKEQPQPCWEGLFLESDMRRDACTALHEGEHKCRVPYGSELPDVSSTRWQDLPVIAWPVFPPPEKCSYGR